MPSDLIAITGCTGYVGGRVAALLSGEGVPLRLVARRPSEVASGLEGEVVYGDYGDGKAMVEAFRGASTVFLVSGREHRDRLAQHRTAVEAAAEAGADRVVYLSFLDASPDSTFVLGRQHYHTEQHIHETGLGYVFLRDSLYADVFPYFVGGDGVLRAPAGDGRVSLVARDDVADAAAAVLVTDRYDGSALDITGPEALTLGEAAERLGRFVGRPIPYEEETEEEAYRSRSVYGAPDWEVEGWVTSFLAIANGEIARVSDAVPSVTGHPARRLDDVLSQHPELYRHLTEPGSDPG
ncbi:MAG: NAD(P)H-binding protein [Actinomycetota bacterium]